MGQKGQLFHTEELQFVGKRGKEQHSPPATVGETHRQTLTCVARACVTHELCSVPRQRSAAPGQRVTFQQGKRDQLHLSQVATAASPAPDADATPLGTGDPTGRHSVLSNQETTAQTPVRDILR